MTLISSHLDVHVLLAEVVEEAGHHLDVLDLDDNVSRSLSSSIHQAWVGSSGHQARDGLKSGCCNILQLKEKCHLTCGQPPLGVILADDQMEGSHPRKWVLAVGVGPGTQEDVHHLKVVLLGGDKQRCERVSVLCVWVTEERLLSQIGLDDTNALLHLF